MTKLRAVAFGLVWSSVLFVPVAVSGQGVSTAEIELLSGDGPYSVATYTDFPDVSEFGDATIYYPADAPGRVAGVAIAPGWTERQAHIEWWGPRLASHGYAVLTLDTNDPRRDQPPERADALIAAVRLLRGEDVREGSPLNGRVNTGRMAVMGHSMGGGGTLIAANEHPDEVQAAIPMTPWQPSGFFDRVTAPTLVLAGSADRLAPSGSHAFPHFESLPSSLSRVYLEVEGGTHYIASVRIRSGEPNGDETDFTTMGRYAIAWLKLNLDGEERYRDLFYGELPAEDLAKFSRYIALP